MRKIVNSEYESFWKSSGRPLVLICILLDLSNDLPIGIWRRNLALHFGRIVYPLVFEQIHLLGTALRVNDGHLLTFLKEDSIHADVRPDRHDIIIH